MQEADAYDLLLNNSGRGSTLADMQAAMQQQWAVPGTQAGGRDDVEEEGDDDGGDAGGGGDDADEEVCASDRSSSPSTPCTGSSCIIG